MSVNVVVFEDQTWSHFRPLCLSIPTYELRLGMFNTRERLELAQKHLGNTEGLGTLLCRDILAPLHTCEGWDINPGSLDNPMEGTLWVNGRSTSNVASLVEMLSSGEVSSGKVFHDDHGLVAAYLSPADSTKLFQSWVQWKNANNTPDQPECWNLPQVVADLPRVEHGLSALGFIWDLVPATADILAADLDFIRPGVEFTRHPFGIYPANEGDKPFWTLNTLLKKASSETFKDFQGIIGDGELWLGENVKVAPSVALDTSKGAIVLDRNVEVMPHCYLEGPLYVGPGSRVKAGATIYGESSFGIGNRISGEIGESTFGDFANKQHDGFIGHAVLGSWTNLGAMTTCSDLKNNYGNVRVDLGFGLVYSGQRFVGLLMGDHVKTAIGTLFNTGTAIGFASNIFGGGMPPKYVANYSWGGFPESPVYDVVKAIETATIVMGRRGCRLVEGTKNLMRFLA